MSLQDEIEEKSQQIRTDSYQMSVGELISLYKDDEVDVHPEFQRIYRWTDVQKTKLIESILLGIPLPPIFVAQRDDGVWDIVDGVQRLSTILQFVGILKDEDGNRVQPLVLQKSKYLPSLEGKIWHNPKHRSRSFTRDQQLYIKRAKLDIKIVLKESDDEAKYELFMRLNTGGTPLSPQEVRNCLMVMAHRQTYHWLRDLSSDEYFRDAIGLSERSFEEQYDMELALRFLIFRRLPESKLTDVGDIGEFLNEHIAQVAALKSSQQHAEEQAFRDTFKTIYDAIDDDAFRRYDAAKHRFMGGFSISAFEAVALGVGYHHRPNDRLRTLVDIPKRVKALWSMPEFVDNSGSGVRASSRIPKIVPLGRTLFGP